MTKDKSIEITKANRMPLVGFGTWKLTGDECTQAVLDALEIGYRHIDTADRYGNHKEVAKAIAQSGVNRKDLFITTKKWRDDLSAKSIHRDVSRFQEELQTDYFDLLLIHWPNSDFDIEETMGALFELKNQGVAKAIGVSNFNINHIKDVLSVGVNIDNNQIEIHPGFYQTELVNYCRAQEISVTAYSPLGHGEDLSLKEVETIAKETDATPAQVILAWLRQKNIITIPKSSNKKRIQENFDSLSLTLTESQISLLDSVKQESRINAPDYNEFDY